MSETKAMKRDFSSVDTILSRYEKNQGALISVLQEVQSEYNYLPEDVLEYVAEKLSISSANVYGVATFYESFSLKPKGKYIIRVCDGTACHVRGSEEIMLAVRKVLNLTEENNTTEDMLFTLDVVSCLGACGLAPAMLINETVYPKVAPTSIKGIIEEIKAKEAKSE